MKTRPSARISRRVAAEIAIAFVVLTPLWTYLLLLLKGLPSFAIAHQPEVLQWVYQATWRAALLSGILVALALAAMGPWLGYLTQPYDFGRCFSFGAIAGALAQAFSTWLYRHFSHRPFSNFWIAGAMIAGAWAGATIVTGSLWKFSRRRAAATNRT